MVSSSKRNLIYVIFRCNIYTIYTSDFLLLTSFHPIIIYMRKGADAGDIIEDDELRSKLYYQKEYIKELEDLLPRMLHLGYFEPL